MTPQNLPNNMSVAQKQAGARPDIESRKEKETKMG
jgi:hypothetical protein